MPWAKSAVGGLVLLAIPFFVAGPIAGSVCLFLALCIALLAWTPLGQWLGFHKDQEAAESPSDFKSRMAEFFREGDELRGECTTVPDGPPDVKLKWALAGGTPEEQCEREEKARDWDARVAEFLWSGSEGKALAPGWKAAGEPPGTAAAHPKQSMMNPSRLAKWYQAKLNYLVSALNGHPSPQPPVAAPRADDDPAYRSNRSTRRRDDAGELAQRCHMLAGSVERWVKAFQDGHSERAEKLVEEWLQADPALDPAEARRRAYTQDEKTWEEGYRRKYGEEARKLFEKAWEMHEIAREEEQLAVEPLAIQFSKVPTLFNEIADSIYAAREAGE